MEVNIFHDIASRKSFPTLRPFFSSCFSSFTKDSIIERLDTINFEGETPLDVAIDYENWSMLQLFMQFNINEYTIVKAIGELLSHYWHIGSSTIDKFIFQLIIKKGYITKQECTYLVERAFDGNAWPFLVPLLNCSDLPQDEVEKYFHWQVSDTPLLRTTLTTLLIEVRRCGMPGESIFACSRQKLRINHTTHFFSNEKCLLSFIYWRRKIVTKRMKKNVRMGHINYKLIKRLMYMY